jgi:hypothetical protein
MLPPTAALMINLAASPERLESPIGKVPCMFSPQSRPVFWAPHGLDALYCVHPAVMLWDWSSVLNLKMNVSNP